jgi:hypothetical protein
MLLAGLRRVAGISLALLGGTVAISALLGFAAGAGLGRSVSVGLYVLGTLLLAGCFVFGVRGPLRGVSRTGETAPLLGSRRIRRATDDERSEATRTALLLFAFGILAILLGSLIDPMHRTF